MPADPAWTSAPPTAPRNRMEPHLKAVAILNLIFGALGALFALLLLSAFGIGSAATSGAGAPGWVPGFIAGLGIVVALFIGLFAALDLTAGILLLRRRRAGKGFGIVAAIVSLVNFPIGTAVGIYALVVLTRPETDELLA